jgi:murein DD-endopeptidase MepM/ murein hydrolase activator NlpD
VESGVQAGPYFFPGYPAQQADSSIRFALFAFAYNLPSNTPLKLVARDAAGNESSASFWFKLFPKSFHSSEMPLDDDFLNRVVPEIMSHTPQIQDQGTTIKNYVEINNRLRRLDHEQVGELARKSPPQFRWKDAFVQLSNSKVESSFADHRKYLYQGKEVDKQDHVGFDLSVTQHYPVEATNDGTVVLADYFGIYGNTVILDHGCGLLSLYGHLSSIGVKVGQFVKKKEILGRSGMTGLAKGDHLHFGLFLQNVPINSNEWWDAKWIKEHILNRLKEASTAPAGK